MHVRRFTYNEKNKSYSYLFRVVIVNCVLFRVVVLIRVFNTTRFKKFSFLIYKMQTGLIYCDSLYRSYYTQVLPTRSAVNSTSGLVVRSKKQGFVNRSETDHLNSFVLASRQR